MACSLCEYAKLKLMGPKDAGQISSHECAANCYKNRPVAIAYVYKPTAWAGTHENPPQTKNDTTNQVTRYGHFFRLKYNGVALEIVNFIFLDEVGNDNAQYNRRTYDPIHEAGLKAKHLLNPEPGYGFGLAHDNPKQNAGKEKFYAFHL